MDKAFFLDMVTLKFMPCHRKPERSLHLGGWQFPVCYRCMFILVGYTSIIPLVFYREAISSPVYLLAGILFNAPMLVDGLTQMKKWRVSNNFLRSFTGLVSGIGMSVIIINLANHLIRFIFHII